MLCDTCVYDTGTDGGGVTMFSAVGTSINMLTTDAVSTALDDLQLLLGEGPCITATSTGLTVLVADLSAQDGGDGGDDPRWAVYAGAASRAGAGAVFAFPILIGAVMLGRVDLYRRLAGPLSAVQLRAGLQAAEDIGQELLELTEADMPGGREHPIAVHQAAGMVMVQLDADIDVAMSRLRARAFADGLTMGELADSVIAGSRRFTTADR
ncbi:MAG: ANTAR domain-containing protein [Nocardioides sp.]